MKNLSTVGQVNAEEKKGITIVFKHYEHEQVVFHGHRVTTSGCSLSVDGKEIAYFDRDSGSGWNIFDTDGQVKEDRSYQMEIYED